MKAYRAVFFDWDGTAVLSRKAPVDEAVAQMRPLLDKGIKLAIISGTTYENIAEGKIHKFFSPKQLQHLYLGLGRGAYEYGFSEQGEPVLLQDRIPDRPSMLAIHDVCYQIHRLLLERYGIETDIVFTRPNYCKIDLMPGHSRADKLFLQEGEADALRALLAGHGWSGGIRGLIDMVPTISPRGISLQATTDAKYLEIGPTGKRDNTNALFALFTGPGGIAPEECCFWGDEFIGVDEGLFGSDSGMITEKTACCDFFDVSDLAGERPLQVRQIGGGVGTFLTFLYGLYHLVWGAKNVY